MKKPIFAGNLDHYPRTKSGKDNLCVIGMRHYRSWHGFYD